MNNESISKLRYVFDDLAITNLIDKTNVSFEQHEKYFIDFYYNLYKLKKQCELKTQDNDKEAFEYLTVDIDGQFIDRNKKISFNGIIKQLFNVDKTQLSRGFNVLKRFSNFKEEVDSIEEIKVKPEFENFSYSKLMELLPYQDDYINKMLDDGKISAKQSVRDIRKALQDKPEIEKFVSEPFDLERNKEYTLQDFRNYGRNDLIAISYQCYQAYLRQKKKNIIIKK